LGRTMDGTMLLFRTFAVLAAALLVGAFGLLVLMPDGTTLDVGLVSLSPTLVGHLRHGVQHFLGAWVWSHVFTPLLVRPVWLIPLCLGMVCAGVSVTTGTPTESPRRTRTRG
jgi:hypothetical protein